MIPKWKLFRKLNRFLVMMPWGIHELRSSAMASKMAAHQWRADHVLVGSQQVKMMRSLTKWTLWWCRTIMSPSDSLRTRWWLALASFYVRKWPCSFHEINVEDAKNGVDATQIWKSRMTCWIAQTVTPISEHHDHCLILNHKILKTLSLKT